MRPTARLRAAALLLATLALLGCEPAEESGPLPAAAGPAATPTVDAAPAVTRAPAAAVTAAASPTPPPPLAADFGDAPDGAPAGYRGTRVIGRFPTRLDTRSSPNPGAHVLTPGPDRLGESVTAEAGADDRADPDGVPNLINGDDGDDGVAALTPGPGSGSRAGHAGRERGADSWRTPSPPLSQRPDRHEYGWPLERG